MTELVEGEFGTCRVCGSPLIGSRLIAYGQASYYCPECHNLTPKPIGNWDAHRQRDWRDEMRERFEIARGPKKIP